MKRRFISKMLPLFCYLVISITFANCKELHSYSVLLEYVTLASDIQGIFGSSSVFIVNAGHYENFPDALLVSVMLKEFSHKYVLSQSMNFRILQEELKYYDGRTVRPLFVIMLKTLTDIYQFANTTKHYNMHIHTWLVIFMESRDEKFNEYCDKPRENLFNLVISTKMLVKCHNNPILKEWYSIDKKKMEVSNYGRWKYRQGVKVLLREHFYQRRSNFKGLSLKASSVKDAEQISSLNGTMSGFFGNVLNDLSKVMNFTIDFVSAEDSYGSWNATTNAWSGVIDRLISKQIDIGIGEFTMSGHRVSVVDFTIPLMLTSSDIYIKRPNMSNVDWSAYIKAFHRDIWILVLIILIITPLILALMWKMILDSNITCHLIEEYLCIWGIYCQKPLPDFPTATSLRLAYISIFMSSLVLFAVYSAYLTSYLTIFTPSIPFDSFEGFVNDGTYKLTVTKNSYEQDLFMHTEESLFIKMRKLLKPTEDLPLDVFTAIKQVCNEKVVLYTNQLFVEKISRYSPCKLMSLTRGRLENIGMVLMKNSPYKEIFNYNLKSLRAFGIIECLKRRYFNKFIYTDSSYLPVAFRSIIPVIGILGLGIVLSLQLLICEYIVHHQAQSANKRELSSSMSNTRTASTRSWMRRIKSSL